MGYNPEIKDLALKSQRVIKLSKEVARIFGKDESTWANHLQVAIMAVIADAMKEAYAEGQKSTL